MQAEGPRARQLNAQRRSGWQQGDEGRTRPNPNDAASSAAPRAHTRLWQAVALACTTPSPSMAAPPALIARPACRLRASPPPARLTHTTSFPCFSAPRPPRPPELPWIPLCSMLHRAVGHAPAQAGQASRLHAAHLSRPLALLHRPAGSAPTAPHTLQPRASRVHQSHRSEQHVT